MKYRFVAFLAFALLFTFTSAAQCKVGNHEFKSGEEYAPNDGECMKYECNPDGTTESRYCPIIADCRTIPGDKTKPYPHCCDTYDCGYNAPLFG